MSTVTVPTTSTQLHNLEDQSNECSQVQGNNSSPALLESTSSDNSPIDQSWKTVINNVVQDVSSSSKLEKDVSNKLVKGLDNTKRYL